MSSESPYYIWRLGSIALLCAILISGCAVGPNYKRPVIDSPEVFRGETTLGTNSFGDMDWWAVYQDPRLQALIREALTNNYDLLIATARVEEERALADQARSQFVPSLEYSGNVSRGRNELFGSLFPDNGATQSSALASLNTFWELDLWGRIRRLNEAARARLLASEYARKGVTLTLLSDVASDYFRLLELDQELEIAAQTTNSFADSLKIFTQRMEGGAGSALETSRAQAALADAKAATPLILE
jgi:multidrug efflux system outer membrane protein